jgi:hypothetical protein
MKRVPKIALVSLAATIAVASLTAWPVHADSARVVSRDYRWHSERLVLDVPARVHFRTAPQWHLTIRGRERTIERLVVSHGTIRVRSEHHLFGLFDFSFGDDLGSVDIDLSGPQLRRITVNGSGKLLLSDLRQERLSVAIRGSGSVTGDGTVTDLDLRIEGSGHLHLAQLRAQDAHVSIAGSGTVAIAPTRSVSVRIEGSGRVRLHSRPSEVSSHVFGSGVIEMAPGAPGGTAAPSTPSP